MSEQQFQYDVFLSHNSKDKPRVRRLAERLRAAGLRVWFDEWAIKAGDDIYLAIERGLDVSRTMVLCLSPAALGSDWVGLERSTVLFRDPANTGRRFIPLLLADCKFPDSLRRYKYIDFRRESNFAFENLISVCQTQDTPPWNQEVEQMKPNPLAPAEESVRPTAVTLEFVSETPFDEFDPDRFIQAFDQALGIKATQFKVLSIRPGSTIVKVLAEEAVATKIVGLLGSSQEAARAFSSLAGIRQIAWHADGRQHVLQLKSENSIGVSSQALSVTSCVQEGEPGAISEQTALQSGSQIGLREELASIRSEFLRLRNEYECALSKIRDQAALLDQAQDAIVELGFDGQILSWNKGAERIYGRSASEAIGHKGSEVLASALPWDSVLREVREIGHWNGEIRHSSGARGEVTLLARLTLMRDADGCPKSILVINTDITEQKRLEAQFLRAQRLESIGALAGGIAHDLNNVIAPMTMSMRALREEIKDERLTPLLDTLEGNARRGADIVRQILTFARGRETSKTALQLQNLVKEVASIVRETFPRSISLKTELPPDLWAVLADATQMHQVLLNLCVNARDAMPDGGELTLIARNVVLDEAACKGVPDAKPGKHVMLVVEDSGIGMAPEILDRIFEPFFTTKEVGKGTGLGLSTVLGIAKHHGGFVRVQSTPGKGSRFEVYFPAAQAIESPVERTELPKRVAPSGAILVVDDEAAFRMAAQYVLERKGYQVITARDGAEAVTIFAQRKQEIAAVLTDIMMPRLDGWATIEALRKSDPSVPIVVVSGSARYLKAEFGEDIVFLQKPCREEDFLQALEQVRRERKALR